ncbi:unnamed protein product [Ectocarpus sp. CCAP 1310/34]|nr:unnamed protein product [Ectocarpus sp. CCAP 1310/34]
MERDSRDPANGGCAVAGAKQLSDA